MNETDYLLEFVTCTICHANESELIATGKDYLHETSCDKFTYVCCKRCGHYYLNPRPTISQISKLYPANYSTFTKKFAKSGNAVAWIKKKVLAQRFKVIVNFLSNDPKILDIGCGDLALLIDLRNIYPTSNLSGLDWNFTQGARIEAQLNKIELITGAIENITLPNKTYDLIIMNQLIEHLWNVEKCLIKCYDSLKDGGFISIETPNPDGWDRLFFKKGGWGGYYWPRHLNLFTSNHLTKILEKTGFEVQKRINLLAPPCWIYSFQFSAKRALPNLRSERLFPDDSLILLGLFAIIDALAKTLGLTTSNQKILAKKVVKFSKN